MFTDIVGYSALTQGNEALAIQVLEEHRRVVRPFLPKHDGKEVKTIGDAFLIEFASALEAVRCAFEIQQSLRELSSGRPQQMRVQLRIGIHVGDVIHSQNDVYGDAVNLASRIEPLAQAGGICVSEQVYYQVKNKFELPLVSLGRKELKNIAEPLEVFRVVLPWENERQENGSLDGRRLAVLPFANFSPDPNDGYFADGITEEIISTVSGISGLSVISRTSVMGYKGTTKKVNEIGRELNVGSVLEGSFRKAGNRIRVTAQLIDVAHDRHIWAQNYDREMDDVFAVQSDVAKNVSEVLRVRILSPERERIEKKPTESSGAYTLYLKGKAFWNLRGGADGLDQVRRALDCFRQAEKEDPSFALAYVGEASCLHKMREWGIDLDANQRQARRQIDRALELDPDLSEAHTTKAAVLTGSNELRLAEVEFRKAIELNPSNATAHHWFFLTLIEQMRWGEALEQIDKAAELDPLSPLICYGIGLYHESRGDLPKALEFYRRSLELGGSIIRWAAASVYGRMGMYDEMRKEFSTWVDEFRPAAAARTVADITIAEILNDRDTVERLLPEAEAFHRKGAIPSAMDIADSYFYLGDKDKGFEWLERSFSRGEAFTSRIQIDHSLDDVRDDPRYLDLRKRLGLD